MKDGKPETIAEFEAAGVPWIYDIGLDGIRAAAQADLNNFMALTRAYGKLRDLLRKIAESNYEVHAELMETTKTK